MWKLINVIELLLLETNHIYILVVGKSWNFDSYCTITYTGNLTI